MVKKLKILIIIVLTLTLGSLTLYALGSNNDFVIYNTENDTNFPYIEDQFLKSSRFTQENNYDQARIDNYLNNFQITYEMEKFEQLGYELALENDKFFLYFENDSYSVALINKETGFIWSSRGEFQLMNDGNDTARNQMNSGIWIDYIRTNLTNYLETTVSLYSATRAEYYTEGEVEEDIRPYLIKPESYRKSNIEVISTKQNNQVITSSINFKALKISFDVTLTLTDTGVNVKVLDESIKEADEYNRLTGIYIFPYLGSTREDNVPGYFVIPDGVGALVRFDRSYNNDFTARFYRNDHGYTQMYLPNLTLPIYGIVHYDNHNAMYANINEGAENTLLQARFWSARSRYFRLSQKFIVRNIYRVLIDRQGNGYDSILEERLNGNFDIDYNFLTDNDANYVGIANSYQAKLFDKNVLTNREISNDNNIPLLINYLMSDRENALLGTKKVTMTTTSDISTIYNNFYEAGLTNQVVNLLGYSTSGNYNTTPYKMNFIERDVNFSNLAKEITNDNNKIFIQNDYSYASANSTRLNYNSDVARNISKTRISSTIFDINYGGYDVYRLYPERALRYAKQDINKINSLGFSGITFSHDVNNLYSYSRGNDYYSRTDSLTYFDEIYQLYDEVLMSSPNFYALEYASAYLNMPVTNSQYDYYTDLIPLIPLVLKGYVSYFTPNLNFNALGQERLLMMVDFGLNPSYILTQEETFKMRNTFSNVFYSTSYSSYENEVINNYNYLNNALKYVINASVVKRSVLKTGIVLVEYSNNVKIYINYTNTNYTHNSNFIGSNDYKVIRP